ncbi:hypothetical protein [Roseateles sp. BYS180W]|uniref:hypothetical protein n=1 Tax=Roseateles rivi TaxID=3299028 RepID=UPI0037488EDA
MFAVRWSYFIMNSLEHFGVSLPLLASPLVSRERWAEMLGLPPGVVIAQCERGMWGAPIRVGKRVFVNVEAIRLQCAERAQEFAL